jgi:FkbM family methyltransferase
MDDPPTRYLARGMTARFVSPKRIFLSLAPTNNHLLYRLCKRYVDLYNGENNDDMETNGELRLMRQVLPQCRVVFDIGANVGHWALLALKVNPRINLHCFEPSRATYQRLLANHFPPNVACNNFGLSSIAGEAKLLIFEEGSGINSVYRRQGLEDGWGLSTQQREETIHLETVDRYCGQRNIQVVDFCKVDVEGHELEVFKGMFAMLKAQQIKMVQFEYGGCNIDAGVLLKDIFCFFQPFDYALYKIYPKQLRLVPRYDQRLENFQYQNWLVIVNGHVFPAQK